MKLSIQAGASLRGVDLPEALALLYDRPFKGVEVGFANIYHFGGNWRSSRGGSLGISWNSLEFIGQRPSTFQRSGIG